MDFTQDISKKIADLMVAAVFEEWQRIEMNIDISENASKYVAVYYSVDNKREQIFVDEAIEHFEQLHDLMAKAPNGGWYSCRFILQRNGKYSIDFGYEKPLWIKESEELPESRD